MMADGIEDMTADELRDIERKLLTYSRIYTGDKEARSMARRCAEIADLLDAATPPIKASAPMTESAQQTARRWLEAGLQRAERLTLKVSGAGEGGEILATILAMLDENRALRDAAKEWREARLAVCASKINTPECANAITRLGHAEDRLSKAAAVS